MKKTYEIAELEIINVETEEIVTTSDGNSSIETPIVPGKYSGDASGNVFP